MNVTRKSIQNSGEIKSKNIPNCLADLWIEGWNFGTTRKLLPFHSDCIWYNENCCRERYLWSKILRENQCEETCEQE